MHMQAPLDVDYVNVSASLVDLTNLTFTAFSTAIADLLNPSSSVLNTSSLALLLQGRVDRACKI